MKSLGEKSTILLTIKTHLRFRLKSSSRTDEMSAETFNPVYRTVLGTMIYKDTTLFCGTPWRSFSVILSVSRPGSKSLILVRRTSFQVYGKLFVEDRTMVRDSFSRRPMSCGLTGIPTVTGGNLGMTTYVTEDNSPVRRR